MNKLVFVLSAAALLSTNARAEIFDCVFTEPFVMFTYDTATEVMKVEAAMEEMNKTVKKVAFQIKGAGTFELAKNGKVLATMTLDNQGSDGMSDYTYPYSVKWNDLYGGCDSSLLERKQSEF